MSLSAWMQIYICGIGRTACLEHVVRSLYAEMAYEWQVETENYEGDVISGRNHEI